MSTQQTNPEAPWFRSRRAVVWHVCRVSQWRTPWHLSGLKTDVREKHRTARSAGDGLNCRTDTSCRLARSMAWAKVGLKSRREHVDTVSSVRV